jgi:hypothetical protein
VQTGSNADRSCPDCPKSRYIAPSTTGGEKRSHVHPGTTQLPLIGQVRAWRLERWRQSEQRRSESVTGRSSPVKNGSRSSPPPGASRYVEGHRTTTRARERAPRTDEGARPHRVAAPVQVGSPRRSEERLPRHTATDRGLAAPERVRTWKGGSGSWRVVGGRRQRYTGDGPRRAVIWRPLSCSARPSFGRARDGASHSTRVQQRLFERGVRCRGPGGDCWPPGPRPSAAENTMCSGEPTERNRGGRAAPAPINGVEGRCSARSCTDLQRSSPIVDQVDVSASQAGGAARSRWAARRARRRGPGPSPGTSPRTRPRRAVCVAPRGERSHAG